MSKSRKVTIGRGGYGEIYYDSLKPHIVYKKSYNHGCASLEREYKTWSRAYRAYVDYRKKHPGLTKHIAIIRPSKYIKLPVGDKFKECIFQLKRIIPLEGEYVWHPQLGSLEPKLDQLIKTDLFIRGRQVGPLVLQKALKGLTTLQQLAKQAGTLIGIVHYVAGLDAYDTELAIGYDPQTDYKLYLIDFDQTKSFKDTPDRSQLIERLVSSLEDVPYYPNPSSDLYPAFKKAYLKVAAKYGYSELAGDVLNSLFTP